MNGKYPEIITKEKNQWVYNSPSKTEKDGTLGLSEQYSLINQQQ